MGENERNCEAKPKARRWNNTAQSAQNEPRVVHGRIRSGLGIGDERIQLGESDEEDASGLGANVLQHSQIQGHRSHYIGVSRRDPGTIRRPHRQDSNHEGFAVHSAVREGDSIVGGKAPPHSGYHRRVAACSAELDVSRAYFRLRGHQYANA